MTTLAVFCSLDLIGIRKIAVFSVSLVVGLVLVVEVGSILPSPSRRQQKKSTRQKHDRTMNQRQTSDTVSLLRRQEETQAQHTVRRSGLDRENSMCVLTNPE